MTRQLEFHLGEIRHVRLRIRNLKNEEFTIQKAEFTLKETFCTEIEDQGGADIIGHVLDVLISPKKKSIYMLTFIFYINDEELREEIKIRVI